MTSVAAIKEGEKAGEYSMDPDGPAAGKSQEYIWAMYRTGKKEVEKNQRMETRSQNCDKPMYFSANQKVGFCATWKRRRNKNQRTHPSLFLMKGNCQNSLPSMKGHKI